MLLHASYALFNCILVTVPKDLSSDRFVLSKVGNSFLPQFHVQLSTTNNILFYLSSAGPPLPFSWKMILQ